MICSHSHRVRRRQALGVWAQVQICDGGVSDSSRKGQVGDGIEKTKVPSGLSRVGSGCRGSWSQPSELQEQGSEFTKHRWADIGPTM